MSDPQRRLNSEVGSTLPLIAGFVALALVLVLVVTAITSLYIFRKRLYTLADAAASSAIEAVAVARLFTDPATPEASEQALSLAARSAATDFVAAHSARQFEALALKEVTLENPNRVAVVLQAQWQPPLVTLAVPEGLVIEVKTSASSLLE